MAVKSGGGGGGRNGAIRAGRAFVELSADDSGLRTVLSRAKSMVLSTGKYLAIAGGTLLGLGGGVLGTVGVAFKETVQHFDEIKKASDRLGTSAESISALGYAASQSGSDIAELEAAAKNLQRNLALNADEFAQFGIDAGKLKGMKLEDQFAEIAEAISSMGTAEEKTAAAMTLLGKSGVRMLPLFKDGAKGVRDLVAEAGKVGSIVSSEDAAAAERAGDAIDRAWLSVKNTFLAVGASLLPQIDRLEMLSAIVVDLVGQVRGFISDNRELVVGITVAAGVVAALGSTFLAVGTTLAVLSLAASGVATAVGVAGTILAAVFSPVGLGIAAIAVAGVVLAALIAEVADLGAIVETVSPVWEGLLETFQKTWGGISDALAAGDLKLAQKVGLAGLDVIWQGALLGMTIAWNQFKADFVDTFHDGVTGIELLWNDAGAAIQQGILSVLQMLAEKFSEFFTKVVGTAADIAEAVGLDSLAGDLRVIQEVGPGVFAEAKKLTEEQRAADEKRITAAAELAQAERNAARQADELAAKLGLAAAKAELEAAQAEARVAANTKEFADLMAMLNGPVNFGKQQAAIAGMSSLVTGQFGGQNLAAQFGGRGSTVEKKQLDAMERMDEKLGKIEKKVGGLPID